MRSHPIGGAMLALTVGTDSSDFSPLKSISARCRIHFDSFAGVGAIEQLLNSATASVNATIRIESRVARATKRTNNKPIAFSTNTTRRLAAFPQVKMLRTKRTRLRHGGPPTRQ